MAIALDNTSSGQGSGSPITFNHTLNAGTDRLLTVWTSEEIADADATAVTYGGQSLTLVANITVGGTFRNHSQIWILLDADMPSDGVNSVSITYPGSGGNLVASASTWTGYTLQAVPVSPQIDTSSAENVTTLDVTPTTIKSTDLVLGTNSSGDAVNYTIPSGYTSLFEADQGTHTGVGFYKIGEPAATLLTLTTTTDVNARRFTGAAVVFEGDTPSGGSFQAAWAKGTNLIL